MHTASYLPFASRIGFMRVTQRRRGRPGHWRVDRFVALVTTIRSNQIARAISLLCRLAGDDHNSRYSFHAAASDTGPDSFINSLR
ncbi:hypothetical protein PISMIDRAFT_685406, partial [Pisolithus microcarpus 441]